MKLSSQKPVTLVGGGLAGPLLGIYLSKLGFKVRIFERRPDIRTAEISAGRSINLALSARGIHALKEVGVFADIAPLLISMKGRMIHPVSGAPSLQPYGKNDTEVIHSVSRAALNAALLTAAEETGVKVDFNRRCIDFDPDKHELTLIDEQAGEKYRIEAETVIATDGATSAIRKTILKSANVDEKSDPLEYGYKELTIPPGPNSSHLLFKNALHIWPRKTFMLIALPNTDGSFTCTLFLRHLGKADSLESLQSPETVTAFFKENFPDVLPFMPMLLHDFFQNPTGHMETIRCRSWHIGGAACLLGDAAHAIVPFFGQGMNCAFEDCSELNAILQEGAAPWEKVFDEFEARRKKNCEAIAAMALENFVEMRDLVANPRFQAKKKLEKILEEHFPDRFIPKYSMVSFHRFPYSVVLERGRIQDRILECLLDQSGGEPEKVDFELAESLMKEKR